MSDDNPLLGGSASAEVIYMEKIGQKREHDTPRDMRERSCLEQRSRPTTAGDGDIR